ncbi:MAG TPA: FAD-dependent oxidoreductase, partial [Acidimicrobiia bacterium]|nr:FAD-dependent oxidoreductase [Acidimicrobiia bacterium]
TFVREATDDAAVLASAEHGEVTTVPARTIVWSAGVGPTDPLPDKAPDGAGIARSRTRRLEVDEHLRLRPGVYAIGDVASVRSGGGDRNELPMLSPPAMQEGRYVAGAIRSGGEPVRPFRYTDKGTMATIGRRAAVAQVGPLRVRGFLGWITWLVVHLYYLIGFRNRATVLASWGWDYLRRDRPIRLIVRSRYDPVVAALVPDDS